jgi:asparagine synthase (glutamine-hydrolysing)
MNGIAGVIYKDSWQINNIMESMLDALSHRGEGSGAIFSFRNIQVGVCRQEPQRFGDIVIALDGVIHNRKSLRAIFHSRGISLASEDSESLLAAAYSCWGTQMFKHIYGNFAVCLSDLKQERVLLAKSRLGHKPLYWLQGSQYFLFASEIKALLASGIIPRTPALEALSAYLYFGYIPGDISPIKNIYKLLPGHYLELRKDGSKSITPYWSFGAHEEIKRAEELNGVMSRFDHLMEGVVADQMPKNAPFGCLLGGGLSSASIAYYLHKQTPSEPFNTYTATFQGQNDVDAHAAEDIARSLQLTHHATTVTPQDFLKNFTKIAWYLDEPIADPNVVATWQVAEIARSIPILFSGMGGDELLAGRYRPQSCMHSYNTRMLRMWRVVEQIFLKPLLSFFGIPQKERMGVSHLQSSLLNYLHQDALFTQALQHEAAPMIAGSFDPTAFVQQFLRQHSFSSELTSYLSLDIHTRLMYCFVPQYERLLSAHGLEWRAPYMSYPVLEFLGNLSVSDYLESEETFFAIKHILKQQLSPFVLHRLKEKRPNFLQSWMELPEVTLLLKRLPEGSLVETGIISKKWMLKHVETPKLRMQFHKQLWAILVLETWFQIFINKPINKRTAEISLKELVCER